MIALFACAGVLFIGSILIAAKLWTLPRGAYDKANSLKIEV